MDKKMKTKTTRQLYRQQWFDYVGFGLRVKVERIAKRMRQEDLASEVGCVRSTISRCERGGAINPLFVGAICGLLSIDIVAYCRADEAEKGGEI